VVVPHGGTEGKLAGILAERVGGPGVGAGAVVVGVGLNVSTSAAGLPVPTATSLLLAGAGPVDRDVLLDAVLGRRIERYRQWDNAGAGADAGDDADDAEAPADAELAAAYRLRCATLGRDVRAELPGGAAVTGRAVDLDDAGRLLVRTEDGVRDVGAGDVVHLR
ncbi:MAG: biotin--[acetyl-CoA-carboxylase] ligase, partial [Actinomycetes bacterium]